MYEIFERLIWTLHDLDLLKVKFTIYMQERIIVLTL